MKSDFMTRIMACALVIIAAVAFAAPADEHPAEPAAGVPEDALFYIHVNNLASIVESAARSGAFDLFRRTGLARDIGLAESIEEWSAMRRELEPEMGFDPWEKIVAALGDKWGVAAWEDGENKIDGVMFARPWTANAVEELLRAAWEVDQRAGDIIEIEEREIGRSRLINVIRGEDKSNWFAMAPDVAFAAYREDLLRKAIDAVEGEIGNLGADERFARAADSFRDKEFFVWADFGRLMAMDIVDLDFGESVPPIIIMLRDGAVNDGAIGAKLVEGGLEADLLLHLNAERMSPPLLDLARAHVTGSSGVWDMIQPEDIAVHVASRHQISKRIEAIKWAMEPDQRGNFERTLANLSRVLGGMRTGDFLNQLGPETSLVVLKPSLGDEGLADALFFLQLAPDRNFRRRLGNSLNTIFSILTSLTLRHAQEAGQPMRVDLRQSAHQGVTYSSLAISGGDLPRGLQPCYGIIGDYLVLASSPRAMARLIDSMRRNQRPNIPQALRLTRNHADLVYLDVEPALAALEQTVVYLAPSVGLDNPENIVTIDDFNLVISILREAAAPVQSMVAHTSYTEQTAVMKLRAQVDWNEWERYRADEDDHASASSERVAAKE